MTTDVPPPGFDQVEFDTIVALAAAENAGDGFEVHIGPYSAYALIGALQLVLRRPDVPPSLSLHLRGIADTLAGLFSGDPAVSRLIGLGWEDEERRRPAPPGTSRGPGCPQPAAGPRRRRR